MKLNTLKQFLFLLLGLFALLLPAQAQRVQPFSYSNTSATNLPVIIIAPDGSPFKAGTVRINFANVTSDLATATLKFYRPGAAYKIVNASNAGTNRLTFAAGVGTTFLTTNQVLLVRRKSTTVTGSDTWERHVNTTNTTSSVTLAIATAGAVNVGDEVYIATLHASILAGANASKEWAYNAPFYNGAPDAAVLVECTATTLGKIPVLSGWWEETK